ncbi:hypothetical protein HQ865_16390 [Mucilaginibacter mali]|uniref:Uncharacterized protein n=1 Tax=Mucilaginibacter mali TaxID=2740462 RepID=A0A7D4QUR7_9SPHI|nr:hypothetical protein [Mucilaginibacter mali]QKJ31269.1 hypothetical protein HQ865_16390 [Mucilaginibacter mali]
MTKVSFTVDDERLGSVERILRELPFVHDIEVEGNEQTLKEPLSQYEKLKRIIDDSKGKDLFKDIEDPSEWQREIRKEWDRDL